ncbi:MAG: Gfo/Idh/MocA family protein [Planctomycetota bacterium]|jgi:predicted dehydrogenase
MAAKKKIRIGVVGLGRIGWQQHLPALKKSRHFELVAASDASAERCAEAEAAYGCTSYTCYEAMIQSGTLDAVVIASPTHLHKAMAIQALKAGLHVLLEKPMALDVKEARAIAAAAKRAKRILTVYQPHRLMPYHQTLKRIIDSGKLGQVYHIRRGMFNLARRNDWQSLKKFGGGMLANYGAHGLDQLLDMTGSAIRKVHCTLRRVASLGDTDDVVKVIYETRSGMVGELDINQASTLNPYVFEVYGTTGAAFLDGDAYVVRSFNPKTLGKKALNRELSAEGRSYPSDSIPVREERVKVQPHHGVDVYADLAKAIRTGDAPMVRPEETVAVMKLIDRCRTEAGRTLLTPMA